MRAVFLVRTGAMICSGGRGGKTRVCSFQDWVLRTSCEPAFRRRFLFLLGASIQDSFRFFLTLALTDETGPVFFRGFF
jgi:hypothetical protein